jgi:hypothetical protein
VPGIYLNPETRDIEFAADGSVALTDEPTTEILLAIGVELNSYHGDPDQGSRIPALLHGAPPVDAKRAVETAAREALQRLVTQGRIAITSVAYSVADRELVVEVDGLTTLAMEV